jgi:hypothetical protein
VTLEPQDPPGGVAHDEHVLGVLRERAEAAPQHRHDAPDGAPLARPREAVGVESAARAQALGVEAGAAHPRPGLLDHRARPPRRTRALAGGVPDPPQRPRVRADVGAGVEGDEGIPRGHGPATSV